MDADRFALLLLAITALCLLGGAWAWLCSLIPQRRPRNRYRRGVLPAPQPDCVVSSHAPMEAPRARRSLS